ncbi:MAG TPA: leukotriene A4 hydrolase C-terminal domain-containing protein [Anaerolineales bacterium]|nr:leukotriene A4 hydrolase C-terminal domain-containing protein [Anaerolineales bacterium]HLO29434.1 leukotriene A4 hydrolase C-terminal domain-containing protein [Anaerolineales bacterium]
MDIKDPTTYTDLSQGKIKHIDFRIGVDFSTHTLDIEAIYQMQGPIRDSLYLDAFKIDLKQAHTNGRELEWEFDARDEILGERLHLKGLEGQSSFTLSFRTSPEARALQWLNASQTAGGNYPFLYSQCQATHARSVFPCQDTPSVRFTYSAEVEVPQGLVAVMAAEQIQVQQGSGQAVFIYKMPQPIPSYLFALGIGNLAFRELGPRTGIYAEPEIIEAAAWEFAENETKIIEAEKLLGPYLWGRYDLLVLPPSFPYGGMENPRLTFLTPTAILGTRGHTSLITHELAHAWTGNLVTNATWQDFWLNEGWTTYAETRITEILEGKDSKDLHEAYNEKGLLATMERVGMDSPYTCLKLQAEKDVDSPAPIVPYHKGCFFLQECEYAVGRERFDAFIQKYMATFQFQSLTTEAFLDFLKRELPEVFEKVNVHQWIYETGLPAEWHRPQSRLFDEVQLVLNHYQQGLKPTREQVLGWHRYQILSFLQGLPKQIPVEDCQYFDDILELEKRNDVALFSHFYTLCIASGYEAILPRIEGYIGMIGRMLYIFPIVRAMIETEWSRGYIRPLFERVRDRHHQITIKAIEGMLKKAGL